MGDPITSTALTLFATGVPQAAEARKQRKDTEQFAEEEKQAAVRLGEEEKKEKKQTIGAMQRRRGALRERTSPRSTILTGPLGVTGTPEVAGKTLLGT